MSSGPITSWQIDREKVETVTDFIFLDSQITADDDCSHKIKRCLHLGRKTMTNLNSIPRQKYPRQRYPFANKGLYSQSCAFSRKHVQMWELGHKEGWAPSIDAFKLCCWRRLLRIPWTARRSNQSILKIKPECSLEGLLLKLKLQYFDHLMWRADSLEKTLMLGKDEGKRRMGEAEDEMVR